MACGRSGRSITSVLLRTRRDRLPERWLTAEAPRRRTTDVVAGGRRRRTDSEGSSASGRTQADLSQEPRPVQGSRLSQDMTKAPILPVTLRPDGPGTAVSGSENAGCILDVAHRPFARSNRAHL